MGDRDKTYLLKELTRTIDESDSTAAFCLCQRWILKDAFDILEKQKPVRPTWLQGKAYCSSCGLGFPRKRADMEINYCCHCGQAVKWE